MTRTTRLLAPLLPFALLTQACAPAARSTAPESPTLPRARASAPLPAETPAPPAPSSPEPAPPTPKDQDRPLPSSTLREVFPHVRVDVAARVVEFDGTICADTTHPQTPIVYLEVLACRPDSREHESLVVSPAMPSHVHAALLLAGFEPGRPGSWSFEGGSLKPSPPVGPRLRVRLQWNQGERLFRRDLSEFVRHTQKAGWLSDDAQHGFVFAGSAFVRRSEREVYAADLSGTIVGLCAFGDEPVAWSRMFSPEASIEDPVWIVDGERLPRPGTPVIVRLESAESKR